MITTTTWMCDVCGEPIEGAERALVVMHHGAENRYSSLQIVHKVFADGRDKPQRHCDPRGNTGSFDLTHFLGDDGLSRALAFLSPGPLKGPGYNHIEDLDGFVDFVRRVQTPHYEEARRHFNEEGVQRALDDANEVYPYQTKILRAIESGSIGQ